MMMLRLSVTSILILALLVTTRTVEAQQASVYRVGIVTPGGSTYDSAIAGLKDGLRELGLEEGKQIIFHVRDVKGDLKSEDAAASTLEAEKVQLLCVFGTSTTLAAKRATKSVPIVFYSGGDPVAYGLVDTFRKPGGRLTGIHSQSTNLVAKRLELLKDMVPRLHRVVSFYNPDNEVVRQTLVLARDAARKLNVEILERPVASIEALHTALRALRPEEADAYFHVSDAMITSDADAIVRVANAMKLPTMFQDRELVARGALASYGASYYAVGRSLARRFSAFSREPTPQICPSNRSTASSSS